MRLLNQELNVFVLIDVDSNTDLRRELFNLNDNPIYHCLFHGTILQEFRDRAPYLVQIKLDQYQYIRYLLKEAAENIMLIFSAHEIDTLFQHWQSLLTVYGLDGDVTLYKFYTPQILGPYLKACKPHEQTQLLAYTHELYLSNELNEWEIAYKNYADTSLPAPELKTCHPALKTAWWHLREEHLIYLQHITEESLVGNMADDLPGQIWIEAHQQYDDNAWHKMQHDYHYVQPEPISKLSSEHALEIKPVLSGIMAG